MKIVKKICIIIGLLILLMCMCVNYYGIEMKISANHEFVEIVFPVDVLSTSKLRRVDVWIIELSNIKNCYHISTQVRKDFRTCYWGENNALWIDGDVGIVLYQYENEEWKEYPVIDMNDDEIVCKGQKYSKLINISLVPREIVERLD